MDFVARYLPTPAASAGPMRFCAALRAALAPYRDVLMMALFGLGLGLSAMTSAVAPLVLALAIQRRLPAQHWLLALAMAVIGGIIAYTIVPGGGWLRSDIWLMRDIAMTRGAPNLWTLVMAIPPIAALPLTGLAVATTIGTGAALTARLSAQPLHGLALHRAALLVLIAMPTVMPGIPLTAFAPAALIALILATHQRDRRSIGQAALIFMGLLLALTAAIVAHPLLAAIGALPMLWATFSGVGTVVKPAANDNPLLARTV
jgi:hypothetical protein